MFARDKADSFSKWCHLGTKIKGITVWQGLKGFCDNKWNIAHECWYTTSRVYVHSHTCQDTCKASGLNCTAAAHTQRNRLCFFRWTDGCREYTLPQNDAVLINLTYRVTKLTLQAALLCFGSKYTWFWLVNIEHDELKSWVEIIVLFSMNDRGYLSCMNHF